MDYNLVIARIIIICIILYIIYYVYTKKNSTKQKEENILLKQPNNWIKDGYGYGYGNSNPAASLKDLIKIFGNPEMYDPKKGGYARWTKEQLLNKPYEQIEIRDEQIPHDKPSSHSDYLYTWCKIDIPEQKLPYLHHISDGIVYDQNKKIMIVRCHDIRANVIIQWIVQNFVNDQITQDEAAGIFGPMYDELLQDHTKYHELESELLQ